MEPTIYLAFADDWELSGDGSGDPRDLQFAPMRELVKMRKSVWRPDGRQARSEIFEISNLRSEISNLNLWI